MAEVEEKYRKAMVSNAQLDNEKGTLMYQVDTLKDSLMELEEMLSESQRGYEDKVKVKLPHTDHLKWAGNRQFNTHKKIIESFMFPFRSWNERNTPTVYCSSSSVN